MVCADGAGRLPLDVLARINTETARIMHLPNVREKLTALTALGLDVAPGSPESLASLIRINPEVGQDGQGIWGRAALMCLRPPNFESPAGHDKKRYI